MKTLTVRGIDPELADLLRNLSKQEGKSLNQVVLETLRKHYGLTKEKKYTRRFHDLDELFGRWSKKNFERIQGSIDAGRKIDRELWK